MNSKQNKNVKYQNLGLIDYQQAWDYQQQLFQGIIDTKVQNRDKEPQDQLETANFLLFCQHPHVYTLGKSGKKEHLLLNDTELIEKHASFYAVNRGGDITYHGPGQLVGYPIFDLDNFFTDIHQYMRFLEEGIIRTLADFGISAGRIEGLTGVWLDHETLQNPRKICAMGVKASRWVTMHGFALNVNPDITYFGNIVPCGIDDKAVTSMALELANPPTIDAVAEVLKQHLAMIFDFEIEQISGLTI